MISDTDRDPPGEHDRGTAARIGHGETPDDKPGPVSPGGTNVSSMSGSGVGGDIDRPDISGRGTSGDAAAGPDHGIRKGPGGGNLGPAAPHEAE